MRRLGLSLFLAFLICFGANSQDPDSLISLLKNTSNPQERIHYLNQLTEATAITNPNQALQYSQQALEIADLNSLDEAKARIYLVRGDLFYYNVKPEDALYYYAQALNLYRQVNYPSGRARASHHIGLTYYEVDDYIKALEYGQEAQKIYLENRDAANLAKVEALLCQVYFAMGGNDKAMTNCFDALKLLDDLDLESEKVEILNSLGRIFLDLNKYDRAEEFFNQALNIGQKKGNKRKISASLKALGDSYLTQKEYVLAQEYFLRAIELDESINDARGLSSSLIKLGEITALQDLNDQALQILNQGLEYAQQLNDMDLQAQAYSEIGKTYSNQENYKLGIENLKNALALALKINARPILRTCYQNLAKFYDKSGDVENAFVYFNLYMRQNEEIYTRDVVKRVAEAETLYELENKDKEIQLLRIENEVQNLQARTRRLTIYFLIGGLISVMIIVIVIYSRYRLKQRANKELEKQKMEIQTQKEEIEVQRDAIKEKNEEISEINEQRTDSINYAKRIQLSLLPENDELLQSFPDSFIFYKPKDIVSGDFYWFTQKDGKQIIATVDCTGHGVPGAFMTVLANTLLNHIVLESDVTEPSQIITLLDQKVQQNLHQNGMSDNNSTDGMDMALCSIDRRKKEVRFTGAKMPLYYVQNNSLHQLQGDRYSIGSSQGPQKFFTNQVIQLKKGDTLYFSSDGFQDQFGGEMNKKFMKSRFRELLGSIHTLAMDDQLNRISETYNQWKNGFEQTDDILVIGIRL